MIQSCQPGATLPEYQATSLDPTLSLNYGIFKSYYIPNTLPVDVRRLLYFSNLIFATSCIATTRNLIPELLEVTLTLFHPLINELPLVDILVILC